MNFLSENFAAKKNSINAIIGLIKSDAMPKIVCIVIRKKTIKKNIFICNLNLMQWCMFLFVKINKMRIIMRFFIELIKLSPIEPKKTDNS